MSDNYPMHVTFQSLQGNLPEVDDLIGASGQNIDYTNAAEAYMKFQIISSLDFTIDVQYEKDHSKNDRDDPQTWIFGGRLNIKY